MGMLSRASSPVYGRSRQVIVCCQCRAAASKQVGVRSKSAHCQKAHCSQTDQNVKLWRSPRSGAPQTSSCWRREKLRQFSDDTRNGEPAQMLDEIEQGLF